MTVNHGRNERGRPITYKIKDPKTGGEMFSFEAGRFSRDAVKRECDTRGIALPVNVVWTTANRWGWNTQERRVE